jgi:hypothetical protein
MLYEYKSTAKTDTRWAPRSILFSPAAKSPSAGAKRKRPADLEIASDEEKHAEVLSQTIANLYFS